jgi:hypothetical protein
MAGYAQTERGAPPREVAEMVKKVRKDWFFRMLTKVPSENVRILRQWRFDPQVDGIVHGQKEVSLQGFITQVGPGGPDYKCVVVYDEGGGRYAVFDQWGGQIYSSTWSRRR